MTSLTPDDEGDAPLYEQPGYERVRERLHEAATIGAGQDKWLDRYAVDVPNLLATIHQAQDATDTPGDQRGLYGKYTVTRNDGHDAPGEKHDGCQYFVLDLTHDAAARSILPALASAYETNGSPELAADLWALAAEVGSPTGGSPGERGTAESRCPDDPHNEGIHAFGDDGICIYCGKVDMLRERGTVTQETSAPPRDLSPDEVVEYVTKARGPLSASAEDSLRHNRLLLATAGLDVVPRMTPPFPNAYPGPQMDGQPTWTCDLGDVIVGDYQVAERLGGPWLDPNDYTGDYADVVRVRRILQPQPVTERWTYEERTTERCGALMRDGVLVAPVYFPGDAKAMCDALNAAEVLVENEDTGT